MDTSIALFEQKEIRKTWFQNQWYFSVLDCISVLTDTINSKDYFKKMRKRDLYLDDYVGTNCPPLEMTWQTGKKRNTLCANTAWILRIIQSVPSPKAEPFKQRLSQVGYERIQEIQDPQLAQQRMKQLYEAKWYTKDRIDKRIRGIAVRQDLTDEWEDRWVKKWKEYAILTAEISKATFGMTPSEYLDYKWLSRHNLRDHMTDLELIFTMLGEASTTEIMKNKDSQGFDECCDASQKWWKVAGDARKNLEKESGKKIVSSKNYLIIKQKEKKKLKKTNK